MKKHIMLGVNGNNCCKLSCMLPFDQLAPAEIEESDFTHGSTNWCGKDDIERTLSLIKMKQTGRKIILKNPIVFHGKDYDWGHEYPWTFHVKEIHELESE